MLIYGPTTELIARRTRSVASYGIYWYLYSSGTVVYTGIYIKVYSETLYPFSAVYSVQYIPVLLSKPAVIIDKSKSEKRCHPVINEGKKSIETQPK